VRRSSLLVLALGVVFALAACGGGGGTQALSVNALKAAAQNTQEAQSSNFTLTVKFDAPGEHYDMHATGVTANDGTAARIDIDIPGVGSMQELLVDDSLYMSLDGLPVPAGELPEGKRWVRIDFGDFAGFGLDLDELREQARNSTPTQGLAYLEGLSGDVAKIGDDTVNGVHATHYRASIDYSKVADQLPGVTDAMREQFARLGTVPADVWIDDNDRVVKTQFTIDGSAFGRDGTAEMTMEMSDFDAPVDVTAPSPDEVITIADLLASAVHA
jgi:hypothetical protein